MRNVLSRGQVGNAEGYKITAGQEKHLPEPLRGLCPTWAMVHRYKAGTLCIQDYIWQYKARLDKLIGNKELAGIYELGDLTFLCYCRDGEFCHTYYAIKWLVDRTEAVQAANPEWDRGFRPHDDLVEWIEGTDWDGECWAYHTRVNMTMGPDLQWVFRPQEVNGGYEWDR